MVVYPVKHVYWDEVVVWSQRLADRIARDYRPDVVIAVGRGGYVVARLLCDLLDVDKLISIPIRWREKTKKLGESYLADLIRCYARGSGVERCIADVVKNLEIEIALDVRLSLRGLKALAVEEISATGLHLSKARDIALNIWNAAEVRTATLVWKASTSLQRPDYVFIETPSFVWFQFPWSRRSDYIQFAKVAIEFESERYGKDVWSFSEAVDLFKKWYGFEPDRVYLSRALQSLVDIGFLEVVDSEFFRVRRGR